MICGSSGIANWRSRCGLLPVEPMRVRPSTVCPVSISGEDRRGRARQGNGDPSGVGRRWDWSSSSASPMRALHEAVRFGTAITAALRQVSEYGSRRDNGRAGPRPGRNPHAFRCHVRRRLRRHGHAPRRSPGAGVNGPPTDLAFRVHRLIGLPGTIGFPTVSRRAVDLESLLGADVIDAPLARVALEKLRRAFTHDLADAPALSAPQRAPAERSQDPDRRRSSPTNGGFSESRSRPRGSSRWLSARAMGWSKRRASSDLR